MIDCSSLYSLSSYSKQQNVANYEKEQLHPTSYRHEGRDYARRTECLG